MFWRQIDFSSSKYNVTSILLKKTTHIHTKIRTALNHGEVVEGKLT